MAINSVQRQPQTTATVAGNQPNTGGQPSDGVHELSPTQLSQLAQKVAELLRFELRIERERQG